MTESQTRVSVFKIGNERPRAPITVVTPTLPGREMLLSRALHSSAMQTLQPEQIIVVHDIGRHGAAQARNIGAARVETEWIAWLDDDDELLPEHLEKLYAAAQETGADLVYSYMEVVGGDDPLATTVNGEWVHPLGVPFGEEQARHLRTRGNFIPVTYLVRTGLVQQVGGMPEPFSVEWPRDCEDYGLLVRLLDAGARFYHVPERTWRYHIHGENTGGYEEFLK